MSRCTPYVVPYSYLMPYCQIMMLPSHFHRLLIFRHEHFGLGLHLAERFGMGETL